MRSICCILVFLLCSSALYSQFYLRGEIKDEANKPLSNVKILLLSTGYIYYSGSSGGFGIMSGKMADSVSISLEGFQSKTVQLLNNKYEYIVLKMLTSASLKKKRLVSLTKDMKLDDRLKWSAGGETYSNLLENEFIQAKKFSETGFAVSIDAFFEISPSTSLNDAVHQGVKNEIAKITLSYRNPDDSLRNTATHVWPAGFTEFSEIDKNYQFATSVIMFASLLKKSKYFKNVTWNDVISMANASYDQNDPLQKEFVELLEKAKKIYTKERRRRKV